MRLDRPTQLEQGRMVVCDHYQASSAFDPDAAGGCEVHPATQWKPGAEHGAIAGTAVAVAPERLQLELEKNIIILGAQPNQKT